MRCVHDLYCRVRSQSLKENGPNWLKYVFCLITLLALVWFWPLSLLFSPTEWEPVLFVSSTYCDSQFCNGFP